MKKLILLIFIALYINNVNCQAPGYLGKRLSFEVSTLSSPALIVPNNKGERGFLVFNHIPGLSFDYTLSKGSSTGVSLSFMKSNIISHDVYFSYDFWPVELSFKFPETYTFETKSKLIGVYYRHYRDGNLAPLGRYTEWKIFRIKTNVLADDYADSLLIQFGSYDYTQRDSTSPFPVLDNDDYSKLGIMLTIGKQRVIKGRFLIDYGVEGGFVFAKSIFRSEDTGYGNRYFFKDLSTNRNWENLGFNFKLGIGLVFKEPKLNLF